MKKFLLSTCISLVCLLVACGNVSKEGDVQSKGENNESKSELMAEEELWNKDKDKELEIFMQKWGKEMNQKYKKYTADSSLDYAGNDMPGIIVGDSMVYEPTVGESPITLKWSTNGKIESGYSLLSVYSNFETDPEKQTQIYLFTVKSGIAKVLVMQVAQPTAEQELVFHETLNKQLKEGFSEIVGSNANYEKEKYSFTKGERIDFLISEYDEIPYNGQLTSRDGVIIYTPEGNVEETTETIQNSIDFAKELSSNVKNTIRSLISVRIELPGVGATSPALTVRDGEIIQANHLFGRVVQGFD